MALLQVEAEKLTLPMLQAGVLEEIVTSDELFALMPFEPVEGRHLEYNRENTLGDASFYDVNDTLGESAATFTKIEQPLKRIIGQVDVDDFLQSTMSVENDQTAIQIAKKSKVVGRKFADALINGNTTVDPKEFDGLLKLVTDVGSPQWMDGGDAALTFAMLDQLIDAVKVGMNRAFVMNSRTLRSYAALQRALGGTLPETVSIGGRVFTTYRGFPILKNDWLYTNQDVDGTPWSSQAQWQASTAYTLGQKVVATSGFTTVVFECTTAGTSGGTEPTWDGTVGNTTADGTVTWTTRSSQYTSPLFAALDEMEGVTGIMSTNQAGIEVVDVGPVEDRDARRWRVRWYTAVALKSTLSLAGVYGVNN